MQRGTAIKWIQALNATKSVYDSSQLGYVVKGTTFLDPFGVLFMTFPKESYKIGWDGVSYIFQGEQFKVPLDFRKRSKMKTDGEEAIVVFTNLTSYSQAKRYIAKNYKTI